MKRSVALGALLGGMFALLPLATYAKAQPPAHFMLTPAEVTRAAGQGDRSPMSAGPTNQLVLTEPAVQPILPAHAVERVVASIAEQFVGADVANERIVLLAPHRT
jgi:hypothetical protein